MRVQVILECTETKLRHYTTTKNKKTHPERLEMMKYNPVLKRHTLYKETKKQDENLVNNTCRSMAQLVEHRSPKPSVEGSSPSWRASHYSVSSHLGAYGLLMYKRIARR